MGPEKTRFLVGQSTVGMRSVVYKRGQAIEFYRRFGGGLIAAATTTHPQD